MDFWDEEIRIFSVAPAGKHIDMHIESLRRPNYFYNWPTLGFSLDHADKRVGDLSVVYTPAKAKDARKFGFVANLWGGHWSLDGEMCLRFHLKTNGAEIPDQWPTALVDTAGKSAVGMLGGTDTNGEWREMALSLSDLEAEAGFDWTSVKLCEFEADFAEDAQLRFDGVCFEGAGTFIGVTDKPVSQRMAEAKASREFRVNHAMSLGARGNHSKAVQAFCKMYLNEDLENANAMLIADIKEAAEAKDYWSLLTTPLYCRFYFWFSNRAGKYPGRMEPDVEKLLLEAIWERTVVKNDIHWARQSTWWMDGSENHDINAKASNLVSSRIFMNEPDYKDRICPDYGFGGGYHYGGAGYYGRGIDPATRHGGGRASLEDGKECKASDHYEAWLAFLKEYFRERAKRGFFLENWANGYTKHTLNMVDLAYQYGGDEELKKIIGDFLTLYWADWAQKQISGVHGGPKTRHKGPGGYDSSTSLVVTYLGGHGSGAVWWYWNLLNDFELPPVVWSMALDRQGMGSFVYRSRGIGEEQNIWPRPPGTERTLLCDTDSRILKYTYVTPDYTLGTQMDHPALVHSHLTTTNRWQGMTFGQSPAARIVPLSSPEARQDNPEQKFDTTTVFFSLQHKDVLVFQASRNFHRITPTWFPGSSPLMDDRDIAVYLGTDWDRLVEKDGWIFVRKGNAYAGIRPVLWDEAHEARKAKKTDGIQRVFNSPEDDATVKLRTDCYTWSKDRRLILLEDPYSPVIIQAGRKADHPSLEGFMANVLGNPIALYKTVVPGFNILVYTGNGEDAPEIVFNAGTTDIPTVGGEYLDYEYPKTFDSPFLQSDYKSGKVRISYGDDKLDLDFTAKHDEDRGGVRDALERQETSAK